VCCTNSFFEYEFVIDFKVLRELLMIMKKSEFKKDIIRASYMAYVLAAHRYYYIGGDEYI
jgi:hypothetical protein